MIYLMLNKDDCKTCRTFNDYGMVRELEATLAEYQRKFG